MLLFAILALAAFVTSIVSGILGMAGGVALIGVMAALLPGAMVVPLHGMVQLFSNASRTALMWREVVWRVALVYLVPLCCGTALAAWVGRGMHFRWLEATIGALLVAFVGWRRLAKDAHVKAIPLAVYVALGFVVGFAALFIGAVGPMIAPFFRRDDWTPKQVVATMAMVQSASHLLKLPAFLALGFDYSPHIPLLAALFVCAVIGTWVGRKVLDTISKEKFGAVFDLVLLALGVWLIAANFRVGMAAA